MPYAPAYLAYLNINDANHELYTSIVNGNYSYALKITQELARDNGAVINDLVAKLMQEENQNLLSYIYQLWTNGQQSTIRQYMPRSFALIFSEADVLLVNGLYKLALKLDVNKNNDGDRIPWGDSSDKSCHRLVWKVLPIWENNTVHFKLKNLDHNMFLKLGLFLNDVGDRPAYGSSVHDQMTHTWYLVPTVHSGQYLFFIHNRQMGQKLKLAVDEDSLRDRRLWGHNGRIDDSLARYLWKIDEHTTEYCRLGIRIN